MLSRPLPPRHTPSPPRPPRREIRTQARRRRRAPARADERRIRETAGPHARRQGPPALRGHSLSRPPARRRRSRTGRRRRVRRRRDDSPDRGQVPPRGRQGRRADARENAAQAHARADGERRARVQLFLAPREHRRGPPSQPPPPHPRARGLRGAGGHRRVRARQAQAGGRRVVEDDQAVLRRRADRARAHRAPDRGAAQEHSRRAARHRAAARRARPAADRARARAQRGAAARA
ncbi:hypothetical protein TR70_3475 [Burkholderia pseudomallei]|nr:hypothetical protein TR70_3475 [Burkholderia pseudomallei]